MEATDAHITFIYKTAHGYEREVCEGFYGLEGQETLEKVGPGQQTGQFDYAAQRLKQTQRIHRDKALFFRKKKIGIIFLLLAINLKSQCSIYCGHSLHSVPLHCQDSNAGLRGSWGGELGDLGVKG